MSSPAPAAPVDAEPAGADAPHALVARCAARAISAGAAAVVDALAARAPELARVCDASSEPDEVLAAGLGLVMLECAGRDVALAPVGAAVARVAAAASDAARLRLSTLAAAAGAFDVAASLSSAATPLDEPLAELAWCVADGPLDGLGEPWRLLVASGASPVELVLAAAAGQRRVHLLTVDRASTLDALHRHLAPGS